MKQLLSVTQFARIRTASIQRAIAKHQCEVFVAFLITMFLAASPKAIGQQLQTSPGVVNNEVTNSAIANNETNVVSERKAATDSEKAAPTDVKPNVVTSEQAVDSITQAELESLVRKLADDSFEGREAGSRGGRAAGNMLVDYFSRYKLLPMGDRGGYFQQFGAGYRNILGYIPGSHAELREEFIMIGAHYDHVGYGTPRNSFGPTGYIHNGADDNGSGTAALMEVMQAVSQMNPKPARSIIFALWDGEEKGLLGSKDWVQNQLNDASRIKLYVNMDMVGRLRNEKLDVYGIRSSTGLRRIASQVNNDRMHLNINWKMRDDSDHYSFWQKDIPAVMLHTGLHDQYHRPSDDVDTINFDGALKVSRMAFRLTVATADDENFGKFRREGWTEGEAGRLRFETAVTNLPSRLGIKVNELTDGSAVSIAAISSGSPAASSELRVGDRVVSINGTAIGSRSALISAIRRAPRQSSFQVIPSGKAEAVETKIQLRGEPARIGMAWRSDAADPSIVLVVRVDNESPAELAGVKTGDRIYSANGERFESSEALGALLKTAPSPINLQLENLGRLRNATLQID